MPISTTTINLSDVDKWCRNADRGVRFAMMHMAESLVAQEQLLKEMFQQMELLANLVVLDAKAQKQIIGRMKDIERKYDNTSALVSFDDPTKE